MLLSQNKKPIFCTIYFKLRLHKSCHNYSFLGHGTDSSGKIVDGLNVVSQTTHYHVVVVAARPNLPNKVPGTDVSIFIIIGVVPSIEVGISDCFRKLMGNHTDSRIYCSIAIGGSSLGETTTTARSRWNSY